MVCSHHQLGECKLLVGPFLWQPDTDGRGAVLIYRIQVDIVVLFPIITNWNNSLFAYLLPCDTMNVCPVPLVFFRVPHPISP